MLWRNIKIKLGMVVPALNSSTWEADAGQPGLCSNTVSKKGKKKSKVRMGV
jgi:hypothetical protein